jgi:hypothetical protein
LFTKKRALELERIVCPREPPPLELPELEEEDELLDDEDEELDELELLDEVLLPAQPEQLVPDTDGSWYTRTQSTSRVPDVAVARCPAQNPVCS